MTTLATNPAGVRDPAEFDTSLQLGESEPLGEGVKRVTMSQIESAAAGFFDGEVPFGEAVHEARKSIKRVRALLRLVRGELPSEIYQFENRSLRNIARLVSDIRDVQATFDVAVSVETLYSDLLSDGTFAGLIEGLARRRDVNEVAAREDPNLVGRVVRGLERAYHRYSSWPTDPEAREVYGLGIRNSFVAMQPGLDTTYGHGRRAMVVAYRRSAPGDFHEWRKRVKDLRHQLEFLAPLWPEVIVGTAMTLDRLGDILGEDNDLADLLALLDRRPDLCPNPRERSLFRALANQRQNELKVASEILGRRVYAEKPKALVFRFGEYWDAHKLATGGSLDTIVVY